MSVRVEFPTICDRIAWIKRNAPVTPPPDRRVILANQANGEAQRRNDDLVILYERYGLDQLLSRMNEVLLGGRGDLQATYPYNPEITYKRVEEEVVFPPHEQDKLVVQLSWDVGDENSFRLAEGDPQHWLVGGLGKRWGNLIRVEIGTQQISILSGGRAFSKNHPEIAEDLVAATGIEKKILLSDSDKRIKINLGQDLEEAWQNSGFKVK